MDHEARGAAGDAADRTRGQRRKNAGVVACHGGAFDVARAQWIFKASSR
jgi:hypothetical protein